MRPQIWLIKPSTRIFPIDMTDDFSGGHDTS